MRVVCWAREIVFVSRADPRGWSSSSLSAKTFGLGLPFALTKCDKLDQQLLRRGAFVRELNSEGNGPADRGHGRRNVNVTHLDAGSRMEAKDLERLWLTSLHP